MINMLCNAAQIPEKNAVMSLIDVATRPEFSNLKTFLNSCRYGQDIISNLLKQLFEIQVIAQASEDGDFRTLDSSI